MKTKEEIILEKVTNNWMRELTEARAIQAMQEYSDQTNAELIKKNDNLLRIVGDYDRGRLKLVGDNHELIAANAELVKEVEELKKDKWII